MSDIQAAENLRALMGSWSGAPYAWKVAINFADGQRRLGLTHSVAAPLVRRELSFTPTQKIFVEAEVAVRLSRDLEQPHADCIDAVAPCLELVDYALPATSLRELLSHSFFHAGIVLGEFVSPFPALNAPYPRADNGAKQHTRVQGVVDDDLSRVVNEVGRLAREAGAPLRRGQLVLCGSYIEPIALRPGNTVEVDYGPELAKLRVSR